MTNRTEIEIRRAAAIRAAHTRALLYPAKQTCSRCDNPRDSTGRYCRACRAAYHRAYRKTGRKTSHEHVVAAFVLGLLGQAA